MDLNCFEAEFLLGRGQFAALSTAEGWREQEDLRRSTATGPFLPMPAESGLSV